VLLAGVTPYLLRTDDNPEGVDGKIFDGIVESLEKDRPVFLEQFARNLYGRTLVNHTVSEAFLEFNRAMAFTASPKATIDLVRAWSETDFRKDLAGFRIPTLVIHGTSDSTVPLEVSGKRAAALIPNSEFLEYEGEPHGLIATAPDKLNLDLLRFLRQ
jgi:pimeloyl-ACP methyl ester carboxylesterase